MSTLIVLAILAALVLWGVNVYNRIITLENRYQSAWSQIDVQHSPRHHRLHNPVVPS